MVVPCSQMAAGSTRQRCSYVREPCGHLKAKQCKVKTKSLSEATPFPRSASLSKAVRTTVAVLRNLDFRGSCPEGCDHTYCRTFGRHLPPFGQLLEGGAHHQLVVKCQRRQLPHWEPLRIGRIVLQGSKLWGSIKLQGRRSVGSQQSSAALFLVPSGTVTGVATDVCGSRPHWVRPCLPTRMCRPGAAKQGCR